MNYGVHKTDQAYEYAITTFLYNDDLRDDICDDVWQRTPQYIAFARIVAEV